MSLTDVIGGALVIEVPLVFLSVLYISRVYVESRRLAQGKVPRLYSIIAAQAAIKAVVGAIIAAILVAFWSGWDTRGAGVVIGLVVGVMLSTPIVIAVAIWRIRMSEEDEEP